MIDMSWEPCILKHTPRYDDPYTVSGHVDKYPVERQMCYYIMCYDIERSLVIEYSSIGEAAQATGIFQQTIRSGVKHKGKVKGRYLFAFSVKALMEAMHERGYQ